MYLTRTLKVSHTAYLDLLARVSGRATLRSD